VWAILGALVEGRRMRLIDEIRNKVERGELPLTNVVHLWSGWGNGQPCAACGKPIGKNQIRYQCARDSHILSFHIRCFGLWQSEVRHRSWRSA
jgi:hypothetical protein